MQAGAATLAAKIPTLLVPHEAPWLRAAGVRFVVSTGPAHCTGSRAMRHFNSRTSCGVPPPDDLPLATRASGGQGAQLDAGPNGLRAC
jgi:hypothetical protein